ncbi:hypothetical protein L1785_20470 [Antribacter sp. KLBMP9083]|uniref:Uncharacterized protein n=1 Tax=Antribacter soli TaxID=2910976 RepID=A0AA41U925_9MICO|nr:hypothetical protein [Antribacter soli]MCF4123346.1 hypothetical protein [Antribacter soli]
MFDHDPNLGPGPDFGPDFERLLEEAYRNDEHAKAAARADITAMSDHHAVEATSAHETIASLVWRTLREMGIRGGRMLVIGQDPEVFAGLPASERRLPPGDANAFVAAIPEAVPREGQPHPGLALRAFDDDAPDEYDVVIAVPPHLDVSLHRPGVTTARRVAQTLTILGCLEHTEPGGYLITLASREVLDDPDIQGRMLIAERGELVGALRLPAGSLRPGLPGNDACVDLLILRRPLVPASPITPCQFLPVWPLHMGDQVAQVNQYWLANPQHVLGILATRPNPWGKPEVTVHANPEHRLHTSLARGLDDVLGHAHTTGLTAETGATIDARLRDAQRHDPNAPIPYTLVDRHDLDTVRQQIGRIRAERRQENLNPAKPSPEPPPRAREPRTENPEPFL